MTTICFICKGVVRQDDKPPALGKDGSELVSHGLFARVEAKNRVRGYYSAPAPPFSQQEQSR